MAAGYDWGKMARYEALFENLVISLSGSDTAEFRSAEKIRFDRLVAEAQSCRVVLKEIGAYIVSKVKDRRISNYFNRITTGNGLNSCLVSTFDLIALVRKYPEHASQISPRGVAVDDRYLKDAARRAVELLQSKGEVEIETLPIHVKRLRQKKLITLCIKAQMDIKKFARAAFVKNYRYYNSNYSSSVRRVQNKKYGSAGQESDQDADSHLP
ncbi:hypothetical protein CHISP_2671 [Chitinispirillum alkaliphilum]|nr:hypothetical protein CHISP_2671 [Chitinispirillum alkaliphilum]